MKSKTTSPGSPISATLNRLTCTPDILSAWRRCRFVLGFAVLGMASVVRADPPPAPLSGNSGGTWGSCDGLRSDSYIGVCGATADPVSNADVVIDTDVPGVVAGGYSNTSDKTVTGNRVTVQAGEVDINIFGGYAKSHAAANNSVTMSGGIAHRGVMGGSSQNGPATNNQVTVTGGSVGSVYGGNSGGGNATDNVVTISGTADIRGDVYGGYTEAGNATGNRIILSGTPTMTYSTLFGGLSDQAYSEGNILEVRGTGLTAKNVQSFQEYHFILPADIAANTTVLTLTGVTQPAGFMAVGPMTLGPVSGDPTDLTGAKVGVALQAGGHVLQAGDRVTLIHNGNGLTTDPTILAADLSGYQGISLRYTFDVSADSNNLYATAAGAPTVVDQTKAPVEGQAGTMALSNQGSDLAGGAGMARAVAATNGLSGTASFGAASGGSSRHNSGSHVDVDGLSMMVGVARLFPVASGDWVAGVFLEGGYANYSSHNDFDGGQKVRGDGKSHYFGGGMLLRHDWAASGQAAPYAEGSLRVGRVGSDWRSQDMIGSSDASYDTSALYYGAHLGLGYVLPLAEHLSLDVSAKYFWTHQNGDKVVIAGDPYEFKAMDSQRTRLGARLNRAFGDRVVGYVGAAWEHEFDGQARATTYGLDTPSPSLKGDTGVFELGFDMKPDAAGPLTVGLGVQAYTGMREGLGGTAKLMFVF